jgi:cytochrome c
VLRIDPRTSAWEVFARGLRAPNGMAIGLDGELFCCDNQGCWLPASRLNHIRKGGFYGHQIEPDGAEPSDPPVVWLPHGEIGNSPTEPILVPDGVFRRQLLVGDVTHGGINRVFVENVQGRYQGAVFQFSQGLEAGVNRLAWGPDGCLYVGGIGADGNWHHKEKKFGLQRLRPNGRIAFEMLAVESRADGFLVTFTQPVPESILTEPESYLVRSWRYRPTIDYGGPKLDQKTLRVEQVVASPDRTRAFLKLSPLEPDTVVYLRLRNFRDDQDDEPFATEAWYTLNTLAALHGPAFDVLSPSLRVPVSPRLLPPSAAPPDVIVLFDGTSAAAFQHADGSPVKWRIEGGPGGPALVVDQGAGDIVTRESFGDCFLHLEWQRNGNSGVKLQSRYEIQIMNAPAAPHPPRFNEAGAIYRLKAPDVNASLGAGVWQTYDIRFRAPRWKDGAKTASARMTAWWNGILVHDDVEVKAKTGLSADEAPGEHPILLQAHPSDAMGEVRFRNVWVTRRTQ